MDVSLGSPNSTVSCLSPASLPSLGSCVWELSIRGRFGQITCIYLVSENRLKKMMGKIEEGNSPFSPLFGFEHVRFA